MKNYNTNYLLWRSLKKWKVKNEWGVRQTDTDWHSLSSQCSQNCLCLHFLLDNCCQIRQLLRSRIALWATTGQIRLVAAAGINQFGDKTREDSFLFRLATTSLVLSLHPLKLLLVNHHKIKQLSIKLLTCFLISSSLQGRRWLRSGIWGR